MAGASSETALQRIEAALTRIENAASHAASRAPDPDTKLVARHEQLRGAVAQSLRRLDDLLAENAP